MDAYRFHHRSEVFSHFLARYAWWQGIRSSYPRPRPLRYPVASVHGRGSPWHFRGELSQACAISAPLIQNCSKYSTVCET